VAHAVTSCAAYSEVIDSRRHSQNIHTPSHRGTFSAWLKTKNMVESAFILPGRTETQTGLQWALLASERDGRLEFAGPAVLNPPTALRAAWKERMVALPVIQPPMSGLRHSSAQWLRPELRVRVRHLKAKSGVLRHATVKQLITE
jgi:hypothetical protein